MVGSRDVSNKDAMRIFWQFCKSMFVFGDRISSKPSLCYVFEWYKGWGMLPEFQGRPNQLPQQVMYSSVAHKYH
eukprot:5617375-Amphidinium_carterae.1